jgi:hypothetical protein
MQTTPQLDAHARRAREYFERLDRLKDEVDDSRIKAGRELGSGPIKWIPMMGVL